MAALILAAGTCHSAPAVDYVKQLEAIIQAAERQTITTPITNPTKDGDKWVKRETSLGKTKYDVKTTNSLVSPLVGIVETTRTTIYFKPNETQLGAEEETEVAMTNTAFATMTYRIAKNEWRLNEAEITWKISSRFNGKDTKSTVGPVTLPPEKLKQEAASGLSHFYR